MRIIENVRLGDIAKVISGFAFKSSEFSGEGVPVVKIANIRVGFLDLDGAQRVNPSYLEKLADKYKVKSGDVLISLTGSHITQPNSVVGRVARASESVPACLLNQRAGKVILNDKDRCDLGFLYYYLTLASLRGDIAAMASGAASQANVSPAQVETLSIDLPPRDEQIRVSSILSTYDDLIENNTRRIEILEEMARRLYEEWFVQFRFPGHEGVEFKESELGLIPASWEVSRIGESFITVLGGTPSRKKSEYWEGGDIPWIASGKANELRISLPTEYITEQGLKSSSAKLMPEGTTVLAITGATLGQVSILLGSMAANQSVVGIYDSSGLRREYIYRHVQFWIWEIIKRASGGAQQHINKDIVNESLYLEPDAEILRAFNNLALPVGDEISNLIRKNDNLRSQRNLLLPKLISGEIDVSDIPMPT